MMRLRIYPVPGPFRLNLCVRSVSALSHDESLRRRRGSNPQLLRLRALAVVATDKETAEAIHSGQPAVAKLPRRRRPACPRPGFHSGSVASKATGTLQPQLTNVQETASRRTAKNEFYGDILFSNTVATEAPHAWIWLPSPEHQKEKQTLPSQSIALSTSATERRPLS